MTKKSDIKIFEDKKVRSVWDDETEEWYFAVVDVVEVLTESTNPTDYTKKLKKRDPELAKGWGQIVTPLSVPTAGGKQRVNCAKMEGVFRLIQSIPSPKAEPFKMWMAQVAAERLDEIADPEKAILRGADYYRAKGYTEGWINQRLQAIEMRKELTDEWKARGIEEEKDYAILTNEMTKAWSGKSVCEYKELKGLKKQNLRDNMTNLELVLNMLAEVTTTAISKSRKPDTFGQSVQIAKEGGSVAGDARKNIESRIGTSVISPLNASDKGALEIENSGIIPTTEH
ncbi:MAG: Bro-N domain-containing protein [Prevotellaceae bacterium]|nr:Bro-N domain-containing protein [Candidatus Colivivens caballi]